MKRTMCLAVLVVSGVSSIQVAQAENSVEALMQARSAAFKESVKEADKKSVERAGIIGRDGSEKVRLGESQAESDCYNLWTACGNHAQSAPFVSSTWDARKFVCNDLYKWSDKPATNGQLSCKNAVVEILKQGKDFADVKAKAQKLVMDVYVPRYVAERMNDLQAWNVAKPAAAYTMEIMQKKIRIELEEIVPATKGVNLFATSSAATATSAPVQEKPAAQAEVAPVAKAAAAPSGGSAITTCEEAARWSDSKLPITEREERNKAFARLKCGAAKN